MFLNRTKQKYDVIFVDVFKSSVSPPFHLMTREAALSMASLLRPDGALLANIFSAIEGKNGRFLRAAVATLKSVFPSVLVFPVQDHHESRAVQNVILVALKTRKARSFTSSSREIQQYLSHRWLPPVTPDMPVLTDGNAPVEHLLLDAVQAFASRTAN